MSESITESVVEDAALARLNPALPPGALDDAFRKLTREGPTLGARNRALHRLLVDGVTVEYRRPDASIADAHARAIDSDGPENDDWLALNQFTVSGNKHARRPDVVLFVNGLPLALVELKNAADVIPDGIEARIGTLTAGREWFKRLRTNPGLGAAA